MRNDSASKLSKTTVGLHWIVGSLMIFLLASGVYMVNTKTFALYSWHKSFGVVVFLFAVFRIMWRIRQGWPKPVGSYSLIERFLSKAMHWVLILATVMMPVSGFLLSAMGGYGVDAFGIELFAKNTNPGNPRDFVAIDEELAEFAATIHALLGNTLIAAVSLHIVGALKHHFMDKDATIRRMLGSNS